MRAALFGLVAAGLLPTSLSAIVEGEHALAGIPTAASPNRPATISARAELTSQSYASAFDMYPNPTCGYITGDAFASIACGDGQFCNNIGGFLGCCSTTVPFYSTWTYTNIYKTSYRLPSSGGTTETYKGVASNTFYSYRDCDYVTTCYNSLELEASSVCTGSCLSNTHNLFCTNSGQEYCLTMTMAKEISDYFIHHTGTLVQTFTAFLCDGYSVSQTLPLLTTAGTPSNGVTESAVSGTGDASSTSIQVISTDVTQSSRPAPAGSGTSAPMSTSTSLASKPFRLLTVAETGILVGGICILMSLI